MDYSKLKHEDFPPADSKTLSKGDIVIVNGKGMNQPNIWINNVIEVTSLSGMDNSELVTGKLLHVSEKTKEIFPSQYNVGTKVNFYITGLSLVQKASENSDKQINEGYLSGSYDYELPKDKEQMLYDFYLSTLLFPPPSEGPNAIIRPGDTEELSNAVTRAKTRLYDALQKELLDAVFFSLSAEIRHFLDDDTVEHAEEILTPQEFEVYKKYLKKHQASKKYNVAPKDRTEIPHRLIKDSSTDYLRSFKSALSADPTRKIMVELMKKLYEEGRWMSSYGGEAWANIADAWLKLYSAKDDMKKMIWIDHVYDLQHNTDTVFNKIKKYTKSGSYGWLKKALDYKFKIKSPWEMWDKISSKMKSLAAPAFKAWQGETLEQYLKDNHVELQKPRDVSKEPPTSITIKKGKKVINSAEDIAKYIEKWNKKKVGDQFIVTGDYYNYLHNFSVLNEVGIIVDIKKPTGVTAEPLTFASQFKFSVQYKGKVHGNADTVEFDLDEVLHNMYFVKDINDEKNPENKAVDATKHEHQLIYENLKYEDFPKPKNLYKGDIVILNENVGEMYHNIVCVVREDAKSNNRKHMIYVTILAVPKYSKSHWVVDQDIQQYFQDFNLVESSKKEKDTSEHTGRYEDVNFKDYPELGDQRVSQGTILVINDNVYDNGFTNVVIEVDRHSDKRDLVSGHVIGKNKNSGSGIKIGEQFSFKSQKFNVISMNSSEETNASSMIGAKVGDRVEWISKDISSKMGYTGSIDSIDTSNSKYSENSVKNEQDLIWIDWDEKYKSLSSAGGWMASRFKKISKKSPTQNEGAEEFKVGDKIVAKSSLTSDIIINNWMIGSLSDVDEILHKQLKVIKVDGKNIDVMTSSKSDWTVESKYFKRVDGGASSHIKNDIFSVGDKVTIIASPNQLEKIGIQYGDQYIDKSRVGSVVVKSYKGYGSPLEIFRQRFKKHNLADPERLFKDAILDHWYVIRVDDFQSLAVPQKYLESYKGD
jgi:hypothetical protein